MALCRAGQGRYARRVGRYFASVCKRGHIISSTLEGVDSVTGWRQSGSTLYVDEPRFCGSCSAPVIRHCEKCDTPIAGQHENVVDVAFEPAPFCGGCGAAFPWATREQRIGQLYNLIDFEDLDEADRLQVAEALAVLSSPDEGENQEDLARAGETFRRLAPKAWETAQPVLSGLLSSWLRKRLGLA